MKLSIEIYYMERLTKDNLLEILGKILNKLIRHLRNVIRVISGKISKM